MRVIKRIEVFDAVQWLKDGDHKDVSLVNDILGVKQLFIKLNGYSVQIRVGDWIVTDSSGISIVMDDASFQARYASEVVSVT